MKGNTVGGNQIRIILYCPFTFFLGPTSFRSDTYFPSLQMPGTGPIRSPAGMLQSANTLTVVDARLACIAWGEIKTMKTDGDQL